MPTSNKLEVTNIIKSGQIINSAADLWQPSIKVELRSICKRITENNIPDKNTVLALLEIANTGTQIGAITFDKSFSIDRRSSFTMRDSGGHFITITHCNTSLIPYILLNDSQSSPTKASPSDISPLELEEALQDTALNNQKHLLPQNIQDNVANFEKFQANKPHSMSVLEAAILFDQKELTGLFKVSITQQPSERSIAAFCLRACSHAAIAAFIVSCPTAAVMLGATIVIPTLIDSAVEKFSGAIADSSAQANTTSGVVETGNSIAEDGEAFIDEIEILEQKSLELFSLHNMTINKSQNALNMLKAHTEAAMQQLNRILLNSGGILEPLECQEALSSGDSELVNDTLIVENEKTLNIARSIGETCSQLHTLETQSALLSSINTNVNATAMLIQEGVSALETNQLNVALAIISNATESAQTFLQSTPILLSEIENTQQDNYAEYVATQDGLKIITILLNSILCIKLLQLCLKGIYQKWIKNKQSEVFDKLVCFDVSKVNPPVPYTTAPLEIGTSDDKSIDTHSTFSDVNDEAGISTHSYPTNNDPAYTTVDKIDTSYDEPDNKQPSTSNSNPLPAINIIEGSSHNSLQGSSHDSLNDSSPPSETSSLNGNSFPTSPVFPTGESDTNSNNLAQASKSSKSHYAELDTSHFPKRKKVIKKYPETKYAEIDHNRTSILKNT